MDSLVVNLLVDNRPGGCLVATVAVEVDDKSGYHLPSELLAVVCVHCRPVVFVAHREHLLKFAGRTLKLHLIAHIHLLTIGHPVENGLLAERTTNLLLHHQPPIILLEYSLRICS